MKFILGLLAVFTLACGPASAQTKVIGSFQAMSQDDLKNDYSALLTSDPAWKELVNGASSMGFTPTQRWSIGAWGEKGTLNRGAQSVTVTWRVYDLDKLGSPNGAALQYVTDGVHTYRALVIAVNRDPHTVQEFTMVHTAGEYRMEAAHGFWNCLENALQTHCEGPCQSALTSCTQNAALMVGGYSWASYMGCLSDACDTCLVDNALTCALH